MMMILSMFAGSVEFYVMAAFLAAAVVGMCVRPRRKGPAVTSFVTGMLTPGTAVEYPEIEAHVTDACEVIIRRSGFGRLGEDSTVALALTRTGFDISIQERITDEGAAIRNPVAVFLLDVLGRERYHIAYRSEQTGLFAAFTLPVKPGITVVRRLEPK